MTGTTYVTNCWEGDWYHVLSDSRLKQIMNNNSYNFDDRTLIINNIKPDTVKSISKAIDNALKIGAFNNFYFVDHHYKNALDAVGLKREDIGVGYNYSISEWVAIYLCNTEYLVYYMGDAIADSAHDWITPSINLMGKYENVKVCNPLWSYKYNEAKVESRYELDDFYIGDGFSDQCFLIRKNDFCKGIYNERHPDEIKFPAYAGDSFERRVYCWMRNNNILRGTYKHCSYIHRNWK